MRQRRSQERGPGAGHGALCHRLLALATDAEPTPLTAVRPDATVPVVITHGATGGHRIALTFHSNMTDGMLHRLDTGQVASYANTAVVDELQARHVPATFFMAGK